MTARPMLKVSQKAREAASRLLCGEKVGAGDGNTYVLRMPSVEQIAEALDTARKQALEEAAKVAEHLASADASERATNPQTILHTSGFIIATAIRALASQNDG